MDMKPEEFTESFLAGITRRVLSRLAAQAYDRLGLFIGPIISGLKILVSRSTELSTATQLDKSLAKVDMEFVNTCGKFLKDLPNLKKLKPHPKELIPQGNRLLGIYGMRDGVPGYSSISYIGSIAKDN